MDDVLVAESLEVAKIALRILAIFQHFARRQLDTRPVPAKTLEVTRD